MSKCQHKVNWDNLLGLDLHVSFVDKKIMQISYHTYESCAQTFLLLVPLAHKRVTEGLDAMFNEGQH